MKKTLKEYLLINLGLFIVAVIIQYFMVPNNFVLGGVSGLAIVIERLVPYLTVGDIMIILNVILFVFGFLLIGRKFGARTIYSSFALSFMVRILDVVYSVDEPLMEDTFAQLIIATLLGAIGLAIVFKNNASTGGTDITAKILNKYFHIDLGKGVLYSDITVALSAFFVFNISTGIYAVLGVVLNGFIIDYILERFKEKKEVVIISEHNEKIKDFIINR